MSRSQRLGKPPQEANVNLYCKQCKSQIGIFENEWIRLTSSYARSKEKGTHFGTDVGQRIQTVPEGGVSKNAAGCQMAEIFCRKCSNMVGQYCKGHIDSQDHPLSHQYFYKLSRTFLKHSKTHHEVDPVFAFSPDAADSSQERNSVASQQSVTPGPWQGTPLRQASSTPVTVQTAARDRTRRHEYNQSPLIDDGRGVADETVAIGQATDSILNDSVVLSRTLNGRKRSERKSDIDGRISEVEGRVRYHDGRLIDQENFLNDQSARIHAQIVVIEEQRAKIAEQDAQIEMLTNRVNELQESIEELRTSSGSLNLQDPSSITAVGLVASLEAMLQSLRGAQSVAQELNTVRAENRILRAEMDMAGIPLDNSSIDQSRRQTSRSMSSKTAASLGKRKRDGLHVEQPPTPQSNHSTQPSPIEMQGAEDRITIVDNRDTLETAPSVSFSKVNGQPRRVSRTSKTKPKENSETRAVRSQPLEPPDTGTEPASTVDVQGASTAELLMPSVTIGTEAPLTRADEETALESEMFENVAFSDEDPRATDSANTYGRHHTASDHARDQDSAGGHTMEPDANQPRSLIGNTNREVEHEDMFVQDPSAFDDLDMSDDDDDENDENSNLFNFDGEETASEHHLGNAHTETATSLRDNRSLAPEPHLKPRKPVNRTKSYISLDRAHIATPWMFWEANIYGVQPKLWKPAPIQTRKQQLAEELWSLGLGEWINKDKKCKEYRQAVSAARTRVREEKRAALLSSKGLKPSVADTVNASNAEPTGETCVLGTIENVRAPDSRQQQDVEMALGDENPQPGPSNQSKTGPEDVQNVVETSAPSPRLTRGRARRSSTTIEVNSGVTVPTQQVSESNQQEQRTKRRKTDGPVVSQQSSSAADSAQSRSKKGRGRPRKSAPASISIATEETDAMNQIDTEIEPARLTTPSATAEKQHATTETAPLETSSGKQKLLEKMRLRAQQEDDQREQTIMARDKLAEAAMAAMDMEEMFA